MKTFFTTTAMAIAMAFVMQSVSAQEQIILPLGYQPDTRIDNMGYWRFCASQGLVPVQAFISVPPATWSGSKVLIDGILIDDSPDVPVTTESSHQSENSIFVNPANEDHVLNSNNSGNWPNTSTFYGSDALDSDDAGVTWDGSIQGPGGTNQGDPVALMNMNGRYFIGYINNAYGQSVSYSDDEGTSWNVAVVSNGSLFNMLDKNHMWVDNSPTSPYNGHLYNGWMESNNIWVSRSITNGESWEPKVNISAATAAGSHNQGVNFKTGPEGEVYAAWSVYDSWPGDEKAIGFAKSYDGGITWETAFRALNNTKGIRTTGVTQNQRVNSFPSMAVDISNSPHRGNIYIIWPNVGVPGINTGTGCDVYMIKSTDEGDTWSDPTRINQDPTGLGKTHYMCWMACDQANGQVSVVFYDNRNLTSSETEAWMAWSEDGGDSWDEMRVSDVSWTPSPIPGMATGYFGDYSAIDAYNGQVYPCWTDNRLGYAMTWVSPISLHIPEALVEYDHNILNDTTFGNANGKMDFNETILLGLEMTNNGDLAANNVTVTLSTESPYIAFEDSTEFYGNFNIGESITKLDAFKYTASAYIPDGYLVDFQVTAMDPSDTLTVSFFTIEAHAPAVAILGVEIDDISGNNNNQLDPGENAFVRFITKNMGEYDAVETVSSLLSSNPFVVVTDPEVNLGTLQPGESTYASFPVSVSPDCPYGSGTLFHNTAEWEVGMDEFTVMVPVGLYVEDWETGNFLKFPWDFCGNKDWVIDPDVKWEGNYSARSGDITHEESSGLTIVYNVLYDDSISFHRKVSSERYNDRLSFYIDNLMVGSWSGNYNWDYEAFPVLAGPHVFKWEYTKNEQITLLDDHGWVDYIVFPPESRMAVSAGGDGAACAGESYTLSGAAMSDDSTRWVTAGDGLFSDPTMYSTLYTPGSLDISAGSVVLTITAYGNYGQTLSDNMTLTIDPPPSVSAGPDGFTCSEDPYTLLDATASNYSAIAWETTGDGTFSDLHILHPVYTPGPQEIVAGFAELKVVATGIGACGNTEDLLSLLIFPSPDVNLGDDTTICAHLTYTLDATTPDAVSYLWTPGGEITPVITVDSTGTGIGAKLVSVTVLTSNGCTGSDDALITFKDCTGINELARLLRIALFPNPNEGKFTIRILSGSNEMLQLRLINATGETVYTGQLSVQRGELLHQVDASQVPAGLYLLELSNEKGTLIDQLIIH